MLADDVQTGQQDAAPFQFGGEGLGDFAVSFGQFLRHAAPARRQVAARFALLRNPRQRVGDNFAADDQHAFVALHDVGQVTLRHDGAGFQPHQGFQNAADVGVVRGEAEDAHAAHAVERFDDDVAVFGEKGAHVGGAGGNDGGRGELREIQHGQFFVEVAHGLPAVEHVCAVACSQGEELGGVEILHVKRRVGAHDYRVKFGQGRPNGACGAEPGMVVIVFCAEKIEGRGLRVHFPALHRQFARERVEQRVAAPRRLAHHRIGGVFIGFETGHRVGDKEDVHRPCSCVKNGGMIARNACRRQRGCYTAAV